MGEQEWLARQFEENRGRLRGVAFRMLGSLCEAEDAVQEAWLRLSRSDVGGVNNLDGWLTTVVARVSLDMLRSRKSRREELLGESVPTSEERSETGVDPEQEALLADSVGLALLVVLEKLAPAERLAFVLHDMFAVPFDEIAPIVGRTSATARQLASRARRRVRGGSAHSTADLKRQREVVGAFLAAARNGDLDALLAVLDPNVVHRLDHPGAPHSREVRGAETVAKGALAYSRSGASETPVFVRVDGAVGVIIAPRGRLARVVTFEVQDSRITEIRVIFDPARFRELDLTLLEE